MNEEPFEHSPPGARSSAGRWERRCLVAIPLFAAFAGVGTAGLVGPARHGRVRLAFTLSQQGRYEEAAGPLAEGFAIEPDSAVGRETQAKLALERGDLAAAEKALDRAPARWPRRVILWIKLARLRERQGRTAEAIEILDALSREDPFDAQVRRELAALRAVRAGGATR